MKIKVTRISLMKWETRLKYSSAIVATCLIIVGLKSLDKKDLRVRRLSPFGGKLHEDIRHHKQGLNGILALNPNFVRAFLKNQTLLE